MHHRHAIGPCGPLGARGDRPGLLRKSRAILLNRRVEIEERILGHHRTDLRTDAAELVVLVNNEQLARFAHASTDLSDGLVADAENIARASKVGIRIDAEAIPLEAPAHAYVTMYGSEGLLRLMTAGDDYQTAFTAPPGRQGAFTEIGRVEAGEGVGFFLNGREVSISKAGYSHF